LWELLTEALLSKPRVVAGSERAQLLYNGASGRYFSNSGFGVEWSFWQESSASMGDDTGLICAIANEILAVDFNDFQRAHLI
jgi:hypothetical protein